MTLKKITALAVLAVGAFVVYRLVRSTVESEDVFLEDETEDADDLVQDEHGEWRGL